MAALSFTPRFPYHERDPPELFPLFRIVYDSMKIPVTTTIARAPASGFLLLLPAAFFLASCFPKPDLRRDLAERPSELPIPALNALDPPSGPSPGGTPVRILGGNFRPGLRVTFGGAEAVVVSVAPDEAAVIAPPGPEGSATVRVENADGTVAAVDSGFTYTGASAPSPAVQGVSHGRGPPAGGGRFWIRGRNFAAGASVSVGGAAAATVEVLHGGLIRATAPAGVPGAADVRVENAGGAAAVFASGYEFVALAAGETLVQGTAEYERRQVLGGGLSGSAAPAPVPFASIEILVESFPPRVFQTETDRWGCFSMVVDYGASAKVRVNARAAVAPATSSILVMDNPTDRALYAVESASFPLAAGGTSEKSVLALAGGAFGVGGAFHILAVCAGCAERAQCASGRALPALHAFWEPGNAFTVWSSAFYFEDLGAGPVPVIQILGGLPGAEDATDTDEFDVSVVAHEFGHFALSSLSTDASPGGPHGGELLVPNLAFSEGFASWFGCACAGSPFYRDTAGRGAFGFLLVAFSCESVGYQFPLVRGIGSEETVVEVLWDLYDGGPEAADGDSDGLALGFVPVLSAAAAFDPASDYPCLFTFLDRAAAAGVVTLEQIRTLAAFPEEQGFLYPPPPSGTFPREIAIPGSVEDFVDARNPYHPPDPSWKFWLASTGGNPYNAVNGFNSRRAFLFRVAAPADVTLTLTHAGSGRYPGDLGLTLLDLHNAVLDASDGGGPVEIIRRRLAPGAYIVEVRGFQEIGMGYLRVNAAAFTLTVE